MNFIQNRFNQIVPQSSSPSQFYSQSMFNSFNKMKNTQLNNNKQNNNSLPDIQTDLIKLLNPQTNSSPAQLPFNNIQSSRVNNFLSPRHSNEGRVKVSFSYGNKSINNVHYFQAPTPRNNIITRPSSFEPKIQYSSLQNDRKLSNLAQLSKVKQPHYFNTSQSITASKKLGQFQKPLSQVLKSHKLGKKVKRFQFSKNIPQQSNFQVQKQGSQNTSFEVVESPRKNISSISLERSQYVFMTEHKDESKIRLEPEVYVFSQSHLESKRLMYKAVSDNNRQIGGQNTSMILPIQQEQNSFIQMPVINQKSQHSSKRHKSPKKIDNSAYLQDQKPSSMTFLDNLQSRGSMLSLVDEPKKKMNKIQKIIHRKQIRESQQKKVAKIQDDETDENNSHSRKQDTQRLQLQKRVAQLQQRLKQKQQQNDNLRNKLQNVTIQKNIIKEQEKLQVMAKLNEVQVKKLQNQIKMFKLKEKILENKEKQQFSLINSLKNEIKTLKNSNSLQYFSSYQNKKRNA